MSSNRIRNAIGFFTAVGAILGLSLATPAWAVPSISITDLTEGSPSLGTTGIDINGDSLIFADETVSFSGLLHIPFGQGVLIDPLYQFVLTEAGGGASDILSITTPLGSGGPGPDDWLQDITILFTSVDGLEIPTDAVTCNIAETGAVQSCALFSQTGDNILNLNVQSDVEVPEPTSLALLGAGLFGLGAMRRRRRANA